MILNQVYVIGHKYCRIFILAFLTFLTGLVYTYNVIQLTIVFPYFSSVTVSFLCIQIIAAITYQIVPADTHYAEIPLAAVRSMYQKKVNYSCSFYFRTY